MRLCSGDVGASTISLPGLLPEVELVAGDAITVSFTGATDENDWIGLYVAGESESSHSDWSYHGSVDGSGSIEVTPPAAGTYYVVMFCCNGYTEITPRMYFDIVEEPGRQSIAY